MKKVFKLTALLLLVGALLVGCKNNGEKYPGNWKNASEVEFWDDYNFTTVNGSEFVYKIENPLINWGSTVTKGYLSTTYYSATKDKTFTGFKATEKANATCGFTFCWTWRANPDYVEGSTTESKNLFKYYYMMIGYDSILVAEQNEKNRNYLSLSDNGKSYWQKCSTLKPIGEENEIVVYTDKNGAIKIIVNGSEFMAISNPSFKSGAVGIIETLDGDDQAANKTVTATYKFKEFQY